MAALAKIVGFSSSSQISRYENGDNLPDPFILLKLSEALDIDLHWLIAGDDPFMKSLESLADIDLETVRRDCGTQYKRYGDIVLDLGSKTELSDPEKKLLQEAQSSLSILWSRLEMLHNFWEVQGRLKALLNNLNTPVKDIEKPDKKEDV